MIIIYHTKKGIILAGGKGTRLYPLTLVTNKHLLAVYDKPMIFYPLAVLMLAGIQDILIISTSKALPAYRRLLGDGRKYGINLFYKAQKSPDGLPQAFIIGEDFIANDSVAMILGDNIFYGNNLDKLLKKAGSRKIKSTIFAYYVNNPKNYGIVDFDQKNRVKSIEEKPDNPKSNYAVTGLYFYDNRVVDYAKKLKPSHRGELEITDLNNLYLGQEDLEVEILGSDFTWFDMGTVNNLIEASKFVKNIEQRTGTKICVLEEIAYRNNWIDKKKILNVLDKYENSPYAKFLQKVAKDKIR